MNLRGSDLRMPSAAVCLQEVLAAAHAAVLQCDGIIGRLEYARLCGRVAYAQNPQPDGDLAQLETAVRGAADQLCTEAEKLYQQALSLHHLAHKRTEKTPFDDPDGPEDYELPGACDPVEAR